MENSLIRDRDIIFTSTQAWDLNIGVNPRNIAEVMAKNNRVLYINAPLDRISAYREKGTEKVLKRQAIIRGEVDGMEKIHDSLWTYYPAKGIESINWIKQRFIFDKLNWRNNSIYAVEILKAAGRLGFKNFIQFNDNDIFRSFYLKDLLNPAVSLYYSRDYVLAVNYWKFHGQRLEPALMAKSDVVIANSTYLTDNAKQYNPHSYYVGQGCDLTFFNPSLISEAPSDLKPFIGKKPIIGYVGALLASRLDIEVIGYIAKARPDWQIVLVGPEDDAFKGSNLHQIENIHFTGAKDFNTLPSYIQYFDVCINPQLFNQLTIGNYPRKIDEYLAMGKPTVATKTRAMEVFAEHTYLAVDGETYVQLIQKGLTENSRQKAENRIAFAGEHTWENNVIEIYKAILSAKPNF